MMMTDTNIRIENAYNGLVEILTEYGAGERANEVADFYIERGLVELDPNIGRYQFLHGALMEHTYIAGAIEIIDGE